MRKTNNSKRRNKRVSLTKDIRIKLEIDKFTKKFNNKNS